MLITLNKVLKYGIFYFIKIIKTPFHVFFECTTAIGDRWQLCRVKRISFIQSSAFPRTGEIAGVGFGFGCGVGFGRRETGPDSGPSVATSTSKPRRRAHYVALFSASVPP